MRRVWACPWECFPRGGWALRRGRRSSRQWWPWCTWGGRGGWGRRGRASWASPPKQWSALGFELTLRFHEGFEALGKLREVSKQEDCPPLSRRGLTRSAKLNTLLVIGASNASHILRKVLPKSWNRVEDEIACTSCQLVQNWIFKQFWTPR